MQLTDGGSSNNFANTQTCTAGYEGARCTQCSSGYYQLSGHCYFCGSSVNQDRTIAFTIIVCVGVMILLAAAVATLTVLRLARAVQLFTLAQAAAAVGVAGSRSSPYFGEQLHAFMTYLNLSRFTYCRNWCSHGI
jgi:hypothetical protein